MSESGGWGIRTNGNTEGSDRSVRGTGPLVFGVVSIGTRTGPFIGPQQTADLTCHLPADRVREC